MVVQNQVVLAIHRTLDVVFHIHAAPVVPHQPHIRIHSGDLIPARCVDLSQIALIVLNGGDFRWQT